ncbi:MAG: hypothetical protein HQ471_01450 [Flavobacteriales bacterium]|jgi:hypothetical protein|nr:hypothetical protein [Flavobacteriales bacterium]
MEGFLKTIDLLEGKLLSLLKIHQKLQENNTNLNEENKRLLEELSYQNQKYIDLEEKFQALKIANTIGGSKDDRLKTKQKINSLIRDIDRCVELINA